MKMWSTWLVVAIGMALRGGVSLNSYSGAGKAPLFGDFEAQRHWQEITLNLDVRSWYEHSKDNDLMYWGLDYPPLTAYHSWINGLAAEKLNSSYVELYKSRGITDSGHKFFMRCTVFVADLLIYLPCVLWAIKLISKRVKLDRESILTNTLISVIFPGQILIDNGHFQYNNISLGLAMLSVALIINERLLWGSIAFTLALNYKQMELYHSLPIFFFLLAQCIPRLAADKIGYGQGVKRLIKIGATVVGLMALLYLPWISNWSSFKQVIHRLFPIARGVFEDKVANFWCIFNVVYKVKDNFSNEEMAKLCLITTLVAVLPTNLWLLFKASWRNFLQSLAITSLGFFLFSFQVHEKSILLVTATILLLLPLEEKKKWLVLFLQTATFSMAPLLLKDGLLLPFFGLSIFFLGAVILMDDLNKKTPPQMKGREKMGLIVCAGSILMQFSLVLALKFVTPPAKLPFLFELLIAAFSAGHFLLYFIYFYVNQFFPQFTMGRQTVTSKKHL